MALTPKQKLWTGIGALLLGGGLWAGIYFYNKGKEEKSSGGGAGAGGSGAGAGTGSGTGVTSQGGRPDATYTPTVPCVGGRCGAVKVGFNGMQLA